MTDVSSFSSFGSDYAIFKKKKKYIILRSPEKRALCEFNSYLRIHLQFVSSFIDKESNRGKEKIIFRKV